MDSSHLFNLFIVICLIAVSMIVLQICEMIFAFGFRVFDLAVVLVKRFSKKFGGSLRQAFNETPLDFVSHVLPGFALAVYLAIVSPALLSTLGEFGCVSEPTLLNLYRLSLCNILLGPAIVWIIALGINYFRFQKRRASFSETY